MSTCLASRVISRSGITSVSSRSWPQSRSPTKTRRRFRISEYDRAERGPVTQVPEHVPVLVEEVRALLQPERGGLFVDCTVGLGGHSRMLLDAGATRLIGIDRDTDAIAIARDSLAGYGDRVTLVHADYREIDAVLDAQGVRD